MDRVILFRRAIRAFVALFISVIVYHEFSITRGFWITLTTAVVLQPTIGATFRKGIQRLVGTYIGILLASVLLHYFHLPWQTAVLFVAFAFLSFYLQAFNEYNYGIFVVPITAMVVMLLSFIMPQQAIHLIYVRCYDSTIGALIAFAITLTVLPISQQKIARKAKNKTIYAVNILKQCLFEQPHCASVKKLTADFEGCLMKNRYLFYDAVYEYLFDRKRWRRHKAFITQAEKLGQLLFGYQALLDLDADSPLLERYRKAIEDGVVDLK